MTDEVVAATDEWIEDSIAYYRECAKSNKDKTTRKVGNTMLSLFARIAAETARADAAISAGASAGASVTLEAAKRIAELEKAFKEIVVDIPADMDVVSAALKIVELEGQIAQSVDYSKQVGDLERRNAELERRLAVAEEWVFANCGEGQEGTRKEMQSFLGFLDSRGEGGS